MGDLQLSEKGQLIGKGRLAEVFEWGDTQVLKLFTAERDPAAIAAVNSLRAFSAFFAFFSFAVSFGLFFVSVLFRSLLIENPFVVRLRPSPATT